MPTRTASGNELPEGGWLQTSLGFVVIHYLEQYASDADEFRGYFTKVHAALARELEGENIDALARDPLACHTYLMPVSTRYAAPGLSTALTSYGRDPYCELYFITPSSLTEAQRCCTGVGEKRDENSDHRGVAHEYGGVLLERYNRKHGGWPMHSAPGWFVQGYEEYLGLTLSTEHSRTVTFEKYKDLLRRDPKRVGYFGVTNDYFDGAVIVLFLHDQFGKTKVQAILRSQEKTFQGAMAAELGTTPDQLQAQWARWTRKALRAPATSGPAGNMP